MRESGSLSDSVVGCIFSNELVDSFPVHRIRRENGAWRELYVDVKDDQFSFQSQPLSFPPGDLPSPLRYGPYPDGYTTEVNFAAFDWLEQMARILKRGVLLTIDYGYEDADYYAPHRTDGTLLCYHRHRTNCNPLDHVGEQDITAHVNFTRLTAWGQQIGLELRRFTDQSNFLVDSCREEIERIVNANPGQPDKARPQLQTLLHPGGMGRAFKVLVQEKRIGAAKLSGLKYTRPL
jgi:SAM-dependent MidA family methyltransferase